jgi:predicted SAM-dependent methyltransferase
MALNIQYGCGLSAPKEWQNYDASPTLRLQRIPLIGALVTKVNFPENVLYGDIVRGLPNIKKESCDAIYCSHVLEHLCLVDFRIALLNTFNILKIGGVFRCVLPDFEYNINEYIAQRAAGENNASLFFLQNTMLGLNTRPKGLKEKLYSTFGNSHHLWMWDQYSLENELKNIGFSSVRKCEYDDSENKDFAFVEDVSRFNGAIAFETIK